jgi:flagellar FliL protein
MAEDQEKDEEVTEENASGPPWLLLGGAVLLALALGAGVTWFLVKPDAERLAALEAQAAGSGNGEAGTQAEAEEPDAPREPSDLPERLLPLDPFVVNVSGHDYARYLKVKIELEADSPATRATLEERLPQVRDGVIVLLSSKRLADITDFEGKALLKEDILHRVNGILEDGRVDQVLFTEFVVQ